MNAETEIRDAANRGDVDAVLNGVFKKALAK
jgi:hypothetical protein